MVVGHFDRDKTITLEDSRFHWLSVKHNVARIVISSSLSGLLRLISITLDFTHPSRYPSHLSGIST